MTKEKILNIVEPNNLTLKDDCMFNMKEFSPTHSDKLFTSWSISLEHTGTGLTTKHDTVKTT